jgi:hypothetical protein
LNKNGVKCTNAGLAMDFVQSKLQKYMREEMAP